MFRYALLSLAFLSSPALAAGFEAQTSTAPPSARFVARDNIWRCAGTNCVSTNRTSTRPAIVCSALARQVGALRGFAVDGRPFDARQLESCNARSR
ncbi:MAG: hypothetical protein QOD42_2648 [Sphingomonadales bacterium]|jgi:hypothetical protein|nr:hypothetical protein [Sphingomonadales bacterium]